MGIVRKTLENNKHGNRFSRMYEVPSITMNLHNKKGVIICVVELDNHTELFRLPAEDEKVVFHTDGRILLGTVKHVYHNLAKARSASTTDGCEDLTQEIVVECHQLV